MTDSQERDLQRRLIERQRRLVTVYQDKSGRLWAVSRPCGCRNERNDLQHEILPTGDSCLIRVTHYPGGVLGPD